MIDSNSFAPSRLRVSELLEQHFDTAFAAPDGVKKLRELILTLAMQGKLVEQDPNDPPASELLRQIEKERGSREGAKTRRKEKLPPIKTEEVPYELPQGWEWVRLGELIELISGQHLTPDEYNENGIGHSYYTGPADFGALNPHASRWTTVDRSMAIQGDILLTVKGAGVGKTNVLADEMAAISRQLMALRVVRVSRDYVLRFLGTIFFELQALAVGIAIPGIGRDDVLLRKFPLPPLPEQHRIVARIDQLMARCDELEKLRKEREEMRLAVHAAAINQLLDSNFASSRLRVSQDSSLGAFVPSCEPFAFLAQHFAELYTVKENVAELRKAILQLAVMGRLVPQDPNDPPASELLKEIEKEKASREGAKTRRKDKELPPIKPEDVPYELPQGWEWVRLGELGYVMGGGTPSKSNPIFWDGSIPWVSPKDMKVDYILDSQDHVSEEAIRNSAVKLIPENSLLIVVRGMILAHSFPTALTKVDVTVNQDMKAIIPYAQPVQKYLLLFTKGMRSRFLNLVERSTHGTCRLDSEKLFSSVIGLPPLPEQQRIAARIDQLMALCDTLDQQIDAATHKQTELLSAVMALSG
jgi:type I restriction enzyme S subunit